MNLIAMGCAVWSGAMLIDLSAWAGSPMHEPEMVVRPVRVKSAIANTNGEQNADSNVAQLRPSRLPCDKRVMSTVFKSLIRGRDQITDSGSTKWQIPERYKNVQQYEQRFMGRELNASVVKSECALVYDVFHGDPALTLRFYNAQKKNCDPTKFRYRIRSRMSADGPEYQLIVERESRLPFSRETRWTPACDSRDLMEVEKGLYAYLSPDADISPLWK